MECGIEFIQLHELDSVLVGSKMNCDGFLFRRFYLIVSMRGPRKTHTSSAIAHSISHQLERYGTLVCTYFHRIIFAAIEVESWVAVDTRHVCTAHQIQVAVMISHLIHCVPAARSTAFAYIFFFFFSLFLLSFYVLFLPLGSKTIREISYAVAFSSWHMH